MEVLSQAPQPVIKCYHSVTNGEASKKIYQEFTPTSTSVSGKNLQSYNFEKSIENFGGSFSFSVVEDINITSSPFMDQVVPLDIIVISENGNENKTDFIGVVTTVSVGGISSNLSRIVTVSGKSIEWLFLYYNIDTDIKLSITDNEAANKIFLTDLANNDGTKGISIKDIVISSIKMFSEVVNPTKGTITTGYAAVSNTTIGGIIRLWYGDDINSFVVADTQEFYYPISSNLFSSGNINVIDYIKKLLPPPIYEIFGFIDSSGKPKLRVREVPYDNTVSKYKINPVLLTDFTFTRSCEDVYTCFMPYVEGSSQSPGFYMNLQTATGLKNKGYDSIQKNSEKIKLYGCQLLTCSFAGYNSDFKKDASNPSAEKEVLDNSKLKELAKKMERWFGNLDEMYSGDFTFVNKIDKEIATIGEWITYATGLFYVISEKHSWTYGDNPMVNYQVTRGGKYTNGEFKKLERLSIAYREFE